MSTEVIADLIWIGFAAQRPSAAWVVGPVAQRLGALQQTMARYPNITPGEEFTGYS